MTLNVANQITLARLGLAIVFFCLLAMYSQREPEPWKLDVATVLFILAAGTDFLDGWIARKYGMTTPLGRMLDPLVDKVLICGSFILLAGSTFVDARGINVSRVEGWMVVVIVGRELLVTGLRGFSESAGQSFAATIYGKIKMWVQSIAVPIILFLVARDGAVLPADAAGWVIIILVWMTVVVTALSMAAYLFRAQSLLVESAKT